ncbi:MAG: iron dicitrate transport regulator FecR [Cyanobacteriota bacterium]|nr:iron dicitrate transport regulator FecR [Cyanobacteriota bacterium]
MHRFWSLLLAPLLWGAAAQAAETAVVQEILDGKDLYIDTARAKVRQKARAPQQLKTGNSRGQLLFDSGAVGRLNAFSQLRLGSGCFLVDRGQVLISGRQNGCTRSARLSVRGTNYVLEVNEAGESEIAVLEGRVEVQPLKDGEPASASPTLLEAGQRLRLSPVGVVLALLNLEVGDYERLLRGPLFRDFQMPLPGLDNLRSYLDQRFPGVSLPVPSSALSIPQPSLPSVPSLPSLGLPRLF